MTFDADGTLIAMLTERAGASMGDFGNLALDGPREGRRRLDKIIDDSVGIYYYYTEIGKHSFFSPRVRKER